MKALNMQFFTIALVVLVGIWITGFENVHWFTYVPVGLLSFAGITGICPGLWFWKKVGLK